MKLINKITQDPEKYIKNFGFALTKDHLNIIVSIIRKYNFGFAIDREDVIQDLLLKLIEEYDRSKDSIYAQEYILPYLSLITHRFCKDKCKYEKRRAHQNIELPKYFNSILIDNTKKQDAEIEIKLILNHLPLIYREITMLYFQGYSHKEISKKLNISQDVSRKRLQRSREFLRRNLKEFPSHQIAA